MPKKKEVGQGLSKILDLIDSLKKDLEKLATAKIREKLQSEKIYDEELAKDKISNVKKEALQLNEALGDLNDAIQKMNSTKGNSARFNITASSVVRHFLEDSL